MRSTMVFLMAASTEEKEQVVPKEKLCVTEDIKVVNGFTEDENHDSEDPPFLSVKPKLNGIGPLKVSCDIKSGEEEMLPDSNIQIEDKPKDNVDILTSKDTNEQPSEPDLNKDGPENTSSDLIEPSENGDIDKVDSPVKVSNGIETTEPDKSISPATGETNSEPPKSDSNSFLPKVSQEPKASNTAKTCKKNSRTTPKARKSGAPISSSIKMVNLAPFSNKKVKVSELESALFRDIKVKTENGENVTSDSKCNSEPPVSASDEARNKLNYNKRLKKRKRKGNYDFPSKKKNYKKKSMGDELEQTSSESEKATDECIINNVTSDLKSEKQTVTGPKSPDRKFMDILSKNSHLSFKRKSKFGSRKVRQSSSFKGKSVMDLLKNNRKSLSPNAKVNVDQGKQEQLADIKVNNELDSTPPKLIVAQEVIKDEKTLVNRKRKSEIGGDTVKSINGTNEEETTVIIAGKKQRKDETGKVTPVITVVSEHQPVTPNKQSMLRSLLPPHLSSTSSQPIATADTKQAQPIIKTDTNSKPSISNSDALRALLVNGPASSINRDMNTVNAMIGTNNNMYKDNKNSLTPNGLSYPVTPPKTPDSEAMTNSTCLSPDRDVIPLCCCKINGAAFNRLSTVNLFCQALDTVDGKVLGCCNKVSNTQLVRPGVKIPFMAICENHRAKLKAHQCCPGCGHFCTQGKFNQCKKEGGGLSIHYFHKQCQVFKDSKYFCPHCGEESLQLDVTLSFTEDLNHVTDNKTTPPTGGRVSKRQNNSANIAKMSLLAGYKQKDSSKPDIGTKHTIGTKSVSLDKLPMGPDKKNLQRILENLGQERPKKYRNLPKVLYMPAYEGEVEKVIYILMDGVDPNNRYEDKDDQTALHAAATNGNLCVVHILVQCGASVHVQDKTLRTPLMCATENDCKSVIQYLVNAGASVDERGEDGMTVLHYAAKLGSMEVIQYLVEVKQMNINRTDDGGWTPMIWAAESKYVEVVRYLMSHGADPGLKDDEENTGLHWAAYAGSVDIINLVLNAGCELNTPNEHGDRPLHIAARRNHYECVVLLLARGGDVEVKNNQGETPLTVCLDKTSPSWMALKVNKQLKGFAAKRLARPEKFLHRDISLGREKNPISCVNDVDDESFPTDYLYIIENVETSPLNINRVITSLQSCRCKDDCSSLFCVCARSSIKCWYDKLGRLITDFNIVEPPLVFECNRACRCWTNCNNRVVQNGITARMQLFRTNGRGWGVKALTDIPKGSFICEYIGELISDCEADRREDDSYLFDLDNKDGETYCIDARKYGNVARFINHLCEPNVIPVKVFVEHQDLRFPRICFFSSREIKAHEELGFDYGEKFWIIKWKQFTCTCGSVKCKYSKDTIQKTLTDYRLRHGVEDTGLDEPATSTVPPPPPLPESTSTPETSDTPV